MVAERIAIGVVKFRSIVLPTQCLHDVAAARTKQDPVNLGAHGPVDLIRGVPQIKGRNNAIKSNNPRIVRVGSLVFGPPAGPHVKVAEDNHGMVVGRVGANEADEFVALLKPRREGGRFSPRRDVRRVYVHRHVPHQEPGEEHPFRGGPVLKLCPPPSASGNLPSMDKPDPTILKGCRSVPW